MKRFFFHFRRYWLQRTIILFRNRFGERGLIIALSFLIGASGAVTAALLKLLVSGLEKFCQWIFPYLISADSFTPPPPYTEYGNFQKEV